MFINSSDNRRGSGKNDPDGPEKTHTEDTDVLWTLATKDVQKIKNRNDVIAPALKKLKRRKPEAGHESIIAIPQPSAAAEGFEIDTRTDQKLRRGQYPIDYTLDLHGMVQEEAYRKLTQSLQELYGRGKRCALVITGKGRDGAGVLRQNLPDWLGQSPLSSIVLKSYPAQAAHGGAGAFYVLLRRNRALS